ncbi:MAG: dephospho-CoA kinase, partial [Cyclobacteriaceae bacterium]
DADSHAKALMTTDGNLKEAIRKEFGTLSFTEQGHLNRNYLASEVFPNQDKLRRLNQLVHPRVAADYQIWYEVQQNRRCPYVVKEAALLYDSGSNRLLDKVIVVAAPDSVRMERVKERDKRSDLDIETIMKRQMPQEEMIQRADFVVENDGKSMILPQILKLHQLFLTFKK